MAYAGALCLLQTYKMQKTDSDYKLMSYQNEIADAAYDSSAINNLFTAKKAELRAACTVNTSNDHKNANGQAIYSDDHSYVANDKLCQEYYVIDETDADFADNRQNEQYQEILADLNNWLNHKLADAQAEEQVWQTKLEKEQVTNAMLQTNIQNFEQMVQNNIASSHTYHAGGGQ